MYCVCHLTTPPPKKTDKEPLESFDPNLPLLSAMPLPSLSLIFPTEFRVFLYRTIKALFVVL